MRDYPILQRQIKHETLTILRKEDGQPRAVVVLLVSKEDERRRVVVVLQGEARTIEATTSIGRVGKRLADFDMAGDRWSAQKLKTPHAMISLRREVAGEL